MGFALQGLGVYDLLDVMGLCALVFLGEEA